MPGLIGFTKSSVNVQRPGDVARAMRDSLVHRPYHCSDDLFEDPCICASRVHLDTVRDGPQPCGAGGIFVWLDGEFYNQGEFDVRAPSDAALLLEQYRTGMLVPFLKKVDGIYSAVIYDRNEKTVRIITDRYGLRYLYVSRTPSGCCWASEIKAFCLLPSRSLTIDRSAAAMFFSQGYLIGNRTWFPDIELLAPGTMLTVKCDAGDVRTVQYLDWLAITGSGKVNDVPELVRELGARFKRAVEVRCREGERISLGLSGGLDSRAVFAAMPRRCEPIQAFSFGIRGSDDLRIARKVTTVRPSNHSLFEISEENWLRNRIDAVWWTDGQLSLLHMHGVEFGDALRERFEVHQNGILSDSFQGAVYTTREGVEVPKLLDGDRRFVAMALVLAGQCVISRMPFFDNALMELGMSIPLKYRWNSNIYHRMLLATFPEFYRDIPWQNTGLPISRKDPVSKMLGLSKRCFDKIMYTLPLRPAGLNYTNYPAWIRHAPAREFFTGLLTEKNALIFDFVDPSVIRRCLDRHLGGLNFAEQIGRYATFELWLQRLNGLGRDVGA